MTNIIKPMRLLLLALAATLVAYPNSSIPPELRFELNAGQTDGRAQFVARSPRYTVFLTSAGALLGLRGSSEGIRIRFADSSQGKLDGAGTLPGVVNYFHGSQPALTNIPTYQQVRQREIYPGVDAIFHGEDGLLEYDFVVAAGADPARIVLAFDGARTAQLNTTGEIELGTAAGMLSQRRPILWQERDGQRVAVEGHYESRGRGQFALAVGKYDRTKPLIIDPTLVFFTSIGGSGPDQVNGLGQDAQGNLFLAGQTASLDFPVVGGVESQLKAGYAYRLDNGGTPILLNGILNSITALAADPKSPSVVYADTQNGLLKTTNSGASWSTIGNGLPSGGVISSIVIDPSNSQVLYAAVENGPGLFKSTDAGATWTAINNGLTAATATDIEISASAVSIDPFQTTHLFVVTGAGEFQSTDGGADWSPYGFQYSAIAFDPNNKGVVYATAVVSEIETIFKSTDDGVTWTAISSVGGAIFEILVDPHNSSTLYVGAPSGMSKSTDGGRTWNGLIVPSAFGVSRTVGRSGARKHPVCTVLQHPVRNQRRRIDVFAIGAKPHHPYLRGFV